MKQQRLRGDVPPLQLGSILAGRFRSLVRAPLVWNAASLYGTTVVTSVLGFAYWFIAARLAPIKAVGLASAIQSASQLIAVVCVLGLNTLLVAELPRNKANARSLISSAAAIVGAFSIALSILVGVIFRFGSSTLRPALSGIFGTPFFVLLSCFSTVLVLLDSASIGLLRGNLQLMRNIVFAVTKLLLLPLAVFAWSVDSGQQLELSWLIGLAASALALTRWLRRATETSAARLELGYYWRRRSLVAGHYALNLSLAAPGFVLPVLAATIIGLKANAGFTAALLIAGFVNTIPYQVGTVLFAVSPGDEIGLARETRRTLVLCITAGLLAAPVLILLSHPILGLFGSAYTAAAGALGLLAITVFPSTVIAHYVAITRVRGQMRQAAGWIALGASCEIGFAAVGGSYRGTTGMAGGVLLALIFQAALFLPTVLRTRRGTSPLETPRADQTLTPTAAGYGRHRRSA